MSDSRLAEIERRIEILAEEVENLKAGVEQGYTVPRPVAERVITQMDGLLALPTADSPFFSPAVRANDEAFAESMRRIVESEIVRALQRARDYLQDEYLAVARETLSITAIPNGAECYEAVLRGYTTIDRSGKDVYELGQKTVAANKAGVIELGSAAYGTEVAIIDAPAGTYGSEVTQLLRRANALLVPVLPSPIDMRAATAASSRPAGTAS